MTDTIRIAHTEPDTDLLGPFRRYVIWVHGCCFDCEGCLAINTRFGPYYEYEPSELAAIVTASVAEGVTLSGGEPFLQAPVLAALVREARAIRDMGVIIYTGFTLDELKAKPDACDLLSLTDLLIDGRYEHELDDGRAYIGSSNQTMHYLTDRYREVGATYYAAPRRRAEIKLATDCAALIGVPSAETLAVWQEMKRRAEHEGRDGFFRGRSAQNRSAQRTQDRQS